MKRLLYYFRPGQEARMLARCQFGCDEDNGSCGATLTYPIKGMPWRRNIMRSYSFDLDVNIIAILFAEISRIRRKYPDECLDTEALWSDFSDRANTVTRDRATNTLCYTVGIYFGSGKIEDYCCLRESSEALRTSEIFKIFGALVAPYEALAKSEASFND
jgi:hypothetical protein